MVFGLTCVVDFLEVEVRVFFDYPVPSTNVRLHRAVGILLLHKVNANHPLPLVGTGLVQPSEVVVLRVHLQAEEDEGRSETGVDFLDLEVHLIEGLHVHPLIVKFDEFAVLVVLSQLA